MADRIWQPFGIIGRTGPGIRQVLGFGNRSTGRGTFRGEFGLHHCATFMNKRHATLAHRVSAMHAGHSPAPCATPPRRGPLPKLLWGDLLLWALKFSWLENAYSCQLFGEGILTSKVDQTELVFGL